MSQATVRPAVTPLGAVTVAWLITSIYYFYQYAMRSAPAVMVPQMSDAFGLTPVGLASLVGLFYYAYAPFSLVAASSYVAFCRNPRPLSAPSYCSFLRWPPSVRR